MLTSGSETKKIGSIVLIALLVTSISLVSGCSEEAAEPIRPAPEWEERPKGEEMEPAVAMILDAGGLEDNFNKGCLSGAEKAAGDLGIKLDYVVAKATAELEELQRQYAEDGKYMLIICAGSAQEDALIKVASEFPEQKFAIIDGTIADKPNIASFLFRDEESSFLAGALSALITKTGTMGFVGNMDIPAIHRFQVGYQAGIDYFNSEYKVIISYVGSWSDPEKAKELALVHYDQGADIVFGAAGASGSGVIEAAKESGLYAVGADTDQRHLAPDNVLISVLKSADIAVFDIIKETTEGDFSPGVRSLGLKEGGVGISLDNSLPIIGEATKKGIRKIRDKIISGELKIPSTIEEAPTTGCEP